MIWEKRDPHSRSYAVLATARSARIGEALGIEDPTRSARCTICHAPMSALPAERFILGAPVDRGVACESCHGAAEPWLRFHTRPDVTHEQRVSAGLRELKSLYGRANTCVACHLNLDAELLKTGHHPEMFFELDGQTANEPPHYLDAGAFHGPRAWLTGQAVALREMSWKLSQKTDDDLVPRWKALIWLLRKNELAGKTLTDEADFASVQVAADRMARTAAHSPWTADRTARELRDLSSLSASFRDAATDPTEQRRRAQLLILGIDRLWAALKKEGGARSENFDAALKVLAELSRDQEAFEALKFAAVLEQLEVALELLPKS